MLDESVIDMLLKKSLNTGVSLKYINFNCIIVVHDTLGTSTEDQYIFHFNLPTYASISNVCICYTVQPQVAS